MVAGIQRHDQVGRQLVTDGAEGLAHVQLPLVVARWFGVGNIFVAQGVGPIGPIRPPPQIAPGQPGDHARHVGGDPQIGTIDPADLVGTLAGLDAETTLFIIASKTFTTLETLTSAASAKAWLLEALGAGEDAVQAVGEGNADPEYTGVRFDLLATDALGNPFLWRRLAQHNDIDNPLRINPGEVLSIPTELAGAQGGPSQ